MSLLKIILIVIPIIFIIVLIKLYNLGYVEVRSDSYKILPGGKINEKFSYGEIFFERDLYKGIVSILVFKVYNNSGKTFNHDVQIVVKAYDENNDIVGNWIVQKINKSRFKDLDVGFFSSLYTQGKESNATTNILPKIKNIKMNFVQLESFSKQAHSISSSNDSELKYIKSLINHKTLIAPDSLECYSFIVAGHLYGSGAYQRSMFPSSSILANIELINTLKPKFFVTLGDIINSTYLRNIINFKKSFAYKLEMPIFNAVGNHDIERGPVGKGYPKIELYEHNFGKMYYHFLLGRELFIFLNTELEKGKIEGRQLDYLLSIIRAAETGGKNQEIKNVFIFSHKHIWLPDEFKGNGFPCPRTPNFNTEIKPHLIELSKRKSVYWISGDAIFNGAVLLYQKDPLYDITYVGTSIHDLKSDAIIQINISKNGNLTFNPISLTGDKLHPVEYYSIEYLRHLVNEEKAKEKRENSFIMRIWRGSKRLLYPYYKYINNLFSSEPRS